MTKSYYLAGKEIVEDEQNGKARAEYGKRQIQNLSERLSARYGRGYSVRTLREIKRFYVETQKQQTLSAEFKPQLSYSHYVILLSLHDPERGFYEQLTIKEKLNIRQLKRAIKTNVYERSLADKKLVGIEEAKDESSIVSATQLQNPITKDPLILDFLGFKSQEKYQESDLEKRIINNIEQFLLEIGKGFAFVGRQYPIYISGKYYHVDLVFYHLILKCYVLIDLKQGNITHQDLGQMMMYVNYFDKDTKQDNDAVTAGVVLGKNKDDAVVEYILGDNKQVFATRYLTYLPSKEELLEVLNETEEINHNDEKIQ